MPLTHTASDAYDAYVTHTHTCAGGEYGAEATHRTAGIYVVKVQNIYPHTYIERERERERELPTARQANTPAPASFSWRNYCPLLPLSLEGTTALFLLEELLPSFSWRNYCPLSLGGTTGLFLLKACLLALSCLFKSCALYCLLKSALRRCKEAVRGSLSSRGERFKRQ
jgi:hypothetical protein